MPKTTAHEMMPVSDKAVSTEDWGVQTNSTCVEVAKLEGVLNTLLENKVESIKNDKSSSSLHSSPKMLINRLRITSTSTNSSKEKDSIQSKGKRRMHRRKNSDEIGLARPHKTRKRGKSKQRISSSSPDSPNRYTISRSCDRTQHGDEDHQAFLYDDKLAPVGHLTHPCCCRHDNNGDIQMHFDEDYISLKIDDCDDYDEEGVMTDEALRRARKKRRKRRKRRMKRHLAAIAAVPVEPEHVKVLEADDLPQRARWTIVATACLLLFMCLLLVGVTLRMAPIIDDMVHEPRKSMNINKKPKAHLPSVSISVQYLFLYPITYTKHHGLLSCVPYTDQMSSFGIDADVPFISEGETTPTQVHSYGNLLQPSPTHSRSASFREDRKLLTHPSLEDIRRCSVGSFHSYHQHHRRNSSRKSRKSQHSDDSSRRHRHPSNASSRRDSCTIENGIQKKQASARRSSTVRSQSVPVAVVQKLNAKERKRRRVVCIVIGTFLFLLFCSVFVVVLTLTHRSEFQFENKTSVYYTFSPHPKVVHGDFLKELPVRKENEELINSLNREQHSPTNITSTTAQE